MNRVLPVLGDDLRPLKALVGHLKAREDSEHEQAILRIVLVGLITLYMWASHAASATPLGIADRELLMGLVGFFVLAIVIFTSICLWPAANPPRRIVGMLADAGGTTFALFLTGSEGVGLIGVYLFITFGNGFRFGRSYLFICQALCLLGFGSVVVFAPWWNKVPAIGWGLVVSLVVLPLYVSTLLKRIQEARARAEEANRAKSSFLANMSHEMRTPLNGIVGITDLLQTTELSPTQTEFMRLLRHSVSLLRSLVDDVLDISKIEAGRIAIEIADFDLHAVLNGLVRLFRPHAAGKGITLRAMVDPAIDYRLRGDSHHLRQVMVNLVSNAIKFTERGHVTIAVELSGETQEGYRLRFEVRDTGIGISDDAQKRIFDQFVQADDSTTRRYGGTGLGTTIAKQLVELMGGAIGVTSVLGEGSTFWFELPLLRSAQVRDTTFIGEQDVAGVVVANDDMLARFKPLISATCGRIEIADSLQEALARVRSIQQEGVSPAVFVSGDVESAQEIFRTVAAENGELSPALIYLTATPPTGFVAQQLRELDGVTWIGPDASPRIVRNAIHLATTTESHTGAEVIDLGLVLKQQRQPLHILVAEDNVTNQTIIRQLLESAGHTVTVAGDGEEALDHYEQRKPDIAILDFNMPERSGLEVLAAIRNMEPVGTRLPTIILSASVTPDTRERAKQVGADEFVGKPFDAAVLLQVVDRLARRATKGAIGQAKPGSASVSRAGVPIVDRARLRDVEKIASGDMEFLAKLFDGFCVDVETMLKRLDSALANARMAEVPDVTHAIKGAALGIGAQQLAARCIDIDQAAAQGDAGRLRGLAAELRRCFDATSAQLTSYRQERLRASL